MDIVWIVLGALILVFTLTDTFFTVLNYNERGLFVNWFLRGEWVVLRSCIAKTPVKARHWLLKQTTGMVLLSAITIWLLGILLGYALIFYGAIGLGSVQSSSGPAGFWDAVYLSIGQFSTVGVEHISAVHRWAEILTVVETLTSIVFLSLTITFLTNIYNCIQALRTLCASFPSASNDVTSPIDSLAPFFPFGSTHSLELHLIDSRVNMNAYFDSLMQDHSGFFFQSGSDRFAMPFAVFNVAGTIEGLRYGLPTGHPASRRPELDRLEDSFLGCVHALRSRYNWAHPGKPTPLSSEDFSDACATWTHGDKDKTDPQVARFCTLVSSMATMSELQDPFSSDDRDDLYHRYCGWLNFVVSADNFITQSSEYLLFQPRVQSGQYPFEPPIKDFGWTPLTPDASLNGRARQMMG